MMSDIHLGRAIALSVLLVKQVDRLTQNQSTDAG